MKISYSNYPILEKIKSGSLEVLPFYEDDKGFINHPLRKNFVEDFKMFSKYFKKETIYVCKPFYEATIKARPKLLSVLSDMMDEKDLTINGTYIINDNIFSVYWKSIAKEERLECVVFAFTKSGIPFLYFAESDIYDINTRGWVSNIVSGEYRNVNTYSSKIIAEIFAIELFKKYANVEINKVDANKKLATINCKYVNDTRLPVTYLDSKWFTTLVKSDGFKVHGHFRMQPKKKDGVWTKEIIWVEDFQKTGYTRKAKIESYV